MANFSTERRILRFDQFEADLHSFELRKRGRKVKLQKKPFLLLAALLERAGDVVTRGELQERLWRDDTVVFDDNLNTATGKLRFALGDTAQSPRFIETLPGRGYRFIGALQESSQRLRNETSPLQFIAVLPLENLAGDPEQEYFADGMTDALITDLARIRALTVISHTSIMQYKGVRKPLRDIARELGVGAIVEGSVLRVGERVRVTAQLIDAASDGHLWAECYDRDLEHVLTLQSELAHAIARKIKVRLSAEERSRLAATGRVDPQAHEDYLKGRYCLNKRTEKELDKAIRYFESAVEKDPRYAVAYSGLSDAYTLLSAGGYGANSPDDVIPKARDAVLTALDIDDTLADAHVSLGLLFKTDWNWPAAEREFKRALELNPNQPTAHHCYALFLMSMVRLDEALSVIRRAQQLDPLSLIIRSAVGRALHFASQLDAAASEYRALIELDPEFGQAHFDLGMTYLEMKRFEQAIEEFDTALELSGVRSTIIARVGISYAEWGKRDQALEVLDQLSKLSETRYVSPYDIAEVQLALGELDAAFENLEKAYRDRDPFMIYLAVDPAIRRARSDPRLEQMMRRMRFPRAP